MYGRVPLNSLTIDPLTPEQFRSSKQTVAFADLHGPPMPAAQAGRDMHLNNMYSQYVNPHRSDKSGDGYSAFGDGFTSGSKWTVQRDKRDGRTRYWVEPPSTRETIELLPPPASAINVAPPIRGHVRIPKNADVRSARGFETPHIAMASAPMSHGSIVMPNTYRTVHQFPIVGNQDTATGPKPGFVGSGQITRYPVTRITVLPFDNRDALKTNPHVHKFDPRERFIDSVGFKK